MTNQSISFPYTTRDVRVIVIDYNPWFVAIDVCAALEIRNARPAVSQQTMTKRRPSLIPTVGQDKGLRR